MAGLAVAHANVHHIPYSALLVPDFRGGKTFPFSKFCWMSGTRNLHYGQSLSARRPFNCMKTRKGLSSTMLILPKASFSIESQAQHSPEYLQSIIKILEHEASVDVKLLPISSPLQLHSENIVEGLSHNFSAIPIEVSVAAIAAIVGSTLGYIVVALPTSKKEKLQNKVSVNTEPLAGEWLLVMKPTPFNRFVMMRCPCIIFEGEDAHEGLSKKLSTEGHHVITLSNHNAGRSDRNGDGNGLGDNNDSDEDGEWAGSVLRIASKTSNLFTEEGPQKEDFTPSYQRNFLHTEDGGVLAVDWPSHLELSGDHGLDTTLLLVSGSADGSHDKGVQKLVKSSVRCGYFPIVLNPRGCGGSPLTTPRLFTAGDSDDVRTAVHFILKSRPSAILMAVGWGYGANMLVKYLGEEAAAAPVTAAVCVENIFDLEELNWLNKEDHDTCFAQKLTSGFVQILKSNQMVFQGRKDFDVQKGLSAKSLRDFDEAISMVSKGYDGVQEFYKDSSSKSWINNVKIPVFYIQDIKSIGKTFSVPHRVFEDNPFTTLILQLTRNGKSPFQTMTTGIYDSLVIEWLAAVEMAFLKGRHPLLQGLDMTFQPQAKGRSARQSQSSPYGGELMVRKMNPLTGFRKDGNSIDYFPSVNQRERDLTVWNRDNGIELNAPHKESQALVTASKNIDRVDEEKLRSEGVGGIDKDSHESSDESGDDISEIEQSQVRQAAESIMKVLDVTMPGTLSEKQKEEVLQAVGRGETIVTALQEACPGDVREKMTTAVSAAVQARGISLKLAGFGKSMPAPKIPDGMVEKIQENLSSMVPNNLPAALTHDAAKTPLSDSSTNNSNEVVGSGDQSNISSQSEGSKSLVQEGLDTKQPESSTSAMEPVHKAGSEAEEQVFTEGQTPEKERQRNSSSESKSTEQEKGDSIAWTASNDSRTGESDTLQVESKATEQEKGDSIARPASNDSRTNQGDTIQVERQGDPLPQEQQKCDGQDQKQESLGVAPQTTELPQTEKRNDSLTDSSSSEDHNKKIPDPNLGEVLPPQIPSQIPAAPPLPSIDMSRAFEALTGLDDSTQMAVTNVFGVIENVLEKLEKEQGQKDVPMAEHQSSSMQTSHNKSSPGITNQKQSSLQIEPSGGNSGHQQISKTGNDESRTKVGETSVQASTNREINQTFEKKKLRTDHNCFAGSSSASTGLENDDTDQELDDADLALEYFEDENVWKLIDVTKDTSVVSGTQKNTRAEKLEEHTHTGNTNLDTLSGMETNQVIKQEYMAVENKLKIPESQSSFPDRNFDDMHLESASESPMSNGMGSTSLCLQRKVQKLVIDALELELFRRLGNSILDTTLQQEIEKIGSAVAETAEPSMQFRWPDFASKSVPEKISEVTPLQVCKAEKLHVETIISAINDVYGNMVTFPSLLPAGVLYGVVLAALSPLDIISTDDDQDSIELVEIQRGSRSNSLVQSRSTHQKTGFVDSDNGNFHRHKRPFLMEQSHSFTDNGASSEGDSGKEKVDRGLSSKDTKLLGSTDACEHEPGKDLLPEKATPTHNNMMGTVAAAMGATAALASQKPSSENLSNPYKHEQQRADLQVTPNVAARFGDGDEADNDDSKPSIVSTLAEKAMSVAAPVVPTKEDGGVDHERLVEILAGLGQKGGILRFVGKMALLWGGLRGAMSLTDRLLVFLHMSDRPLYQRILGFMVMAFLLWSPVLVPLLPALLQQWASGSHNGVASTAALIGLYGAVVILITIWGKKIRGYEDPLQQYGVSIDPAFNARQLQSLMSGLALGLSLVASVYVLGVSLHILQFDWAPALSFNSSKTFLWNLVSGWRIFKLLVQCFSISLAVSFVKELFFRSWLQEEISADLGFHRATALSGLAFSISHWSLPVMPGLWLLSLVLTGVKVGCNGDLIPAIGIHAGLIAGTQLITIGCQVKYAANASLLFIGHQTGDPFTGLIGVSILAVLALLFYPWGYNGEDKH